MKIALVQSHIVWEDKAENIRNFEQTLSENPGTDLFLLPEMSFTGFSMNTAKTGEGKRETAEKISGLAIRYNTAIGFGWVRRTEEKCENVYTILGIRGQLVSEFVKVHPFSFSGEDRYFSGGKELSIFRFCGVPFSVFICYDLRFPELFRAVCRNVHAVIIPANWPAKRSEHWKTLLRARAIENQVYILAVNCAGEMDGVYYSGDSCVIDPNGEVKYSLSDREGVITFEFNDEADRFRRTFPVLNDIVNIS